MDYPRSRPSRTYAQELSPAEPEVANRRDTKISEEMNLLTQRHEELITKRELLLDIQKDYLKGRKRTTAAIEKDYQKMKERNDKILNDLSYADRKLRQLSNEHRDGKMIALRNSYLDYIHNEFPEWIEHTHATKTEGT